MTKPTTFTYLKLLTQGSIAGFVQGGIAGVCLGGIPALCLETVRCILANMLNNNLYREKN